MSTETRTMDDDDMLLDNFGITDTWTRDGGVVVGTLTREQYMARRDRAAECHMVRPGVEKSKPRPDARDRLAFDA